MASWVTGGLPLLSPPSSQVGVVSATISTNIPPLCPLSIIQEWRVVTRLPRWQRPALPTEMLFRNLWVTAIRRLTMQSHMSYSSCSCFCLLERTIQICVSCIRAVKIWCFEYNSLILTTVCSTWHLMANNTLRIWELELLLSTKMAEAIRSSVTPWNWVTVQWPVSYRGFPRRVSLRTGLARVDQRSWVLVLCIRCRSWLQKTDAWVLPALL